MTYDDTLALLALLDAGSLRYAPAMDDALVAVWFDGLRDLSATAVLAAGRQVIVGDEDFPQVARVRQLVKEAQRTERQRALPAQGERAGYRCKCQDIGMVEVQGQRDAWRPCQQCNFDGFARWEAGDYATKTFRAVLDPVDVESSRKHLEKARAVLEGARQAKRPQVSVYEEGAA